MPRKRTLIPAPLQWTATNSPVAHPPLPVLAERGGTQLRTPLPVAIVDTREQNPLSFRRFKGWFSKVEHRALRLGDYSVAGMEDTCIVERKDLADLICSFTTNRSVFIARLAEWQTSRTACLWLLRRLPRSRRSILTAPRIRTALHNRSLPFSPGFACRLSAPTRTNSERKSSRRICIRRFCMIGWTATAMVTSWLMATCSLEMLKTTVG